MKNFDVIILGAGASGCMCASRLGLTNKTVLMIDRASFAGKKLLATGNGRCNITNLCLQENNAYNQDLKEFFSRCDYKKTILYFKDMGLEVYIDDENRVYPLSNTAKSVIDVFANNFAKNPRLTIQTETEILNVTKNNDIFEVETDKGSFSCQKLVVALGGGKGKEFLKKFDIPYKKITPSLCALKTEKTKLLENTRVSNVKVTAKTKSGKTFSQRGEILFKDSGLSGICILSLSSLFAREGCFEGQVFVDLTEYNDKFLKKLLLERRALDVKVSKFFEGLFANPVAYHLLNILKLDEEKSSLKLTEDEIDQMCKLIKNLPFTVKGHYDNNQVFSGGVLLSALDKNLQSKQIPNLYFCGEICDVDGICGGFNLQWAWTSGYIVAESI